MDYNRFHLSVMDWGKIAACSLGIMTAVSYLFYDSLVGMAGTLICIYFLKKIWVKRQVKRQKRNLANQFQDTMQLVSNSLLSGYSIENAWSDAQRELVKLYGQDAHMCRELQRMNQSMALNLPIEELLADFATRSGVEDIQNFSEVFTFAKHSGGNLVLIIENTVNHMRAKREVEQEIEVLVASKKLEQNILTIIPLFILAYLKFSSMEYMSVLYRNPFGVVFMTGCLLVYIFAIVISWKILNIQI